MRPGTLGRKRVTAGPWTRSHPRPRSPRSRPTRATTVLRASSSRQAAGAVSVQARRRRLRALRVSPDLQRARCGPHTIRSGQRMLPATSAPATCSWMIDTTAPTTEITVKPLDPSNDGSPTFSFTASEGSSSFACKLDNGAFEACVTPKTYSAVAAGSHTFSVRATDAAEYRYRRHLHLDDRYGRADDDDHAEAGNPSNDSSPSFAFAASEAGNQSRVVSTVEVLRPVSPSETYTGLATALILRGSGRDAAGNLGVETSFTGGRHRCSAATIIVKPSDPTMPAPELLLHGEPGRSSFSASSTAPVCAVHIAHRLSGARRRAAPSSLRRGSAGNRAWKRPTRRSTVSRRR